MENEYDLVGCEGVAARVRWVSEIPFRTMRGGWVAEVTVAGVTMDVIALDVESAKAGALGHGSVSV